MIIQWDVDLRWKTTAGDLDDSTKRRYYAAPPPYLIVLVLQEGVIDAIDGMAGNMIGLKFDCSVGYHFADAPLGFTLPKFAGFEHSKISVRRLVEKTPADNTLSGILAGAPTEKELDHLSFNIASGEIVTAELPMILALKARQLALKQGVSVDVLIWDALLDLVEEHGV